MSAKVFDSLPPDLQTVLREVGREMQMVTTAAIIAESRTMKPPPLVKARKS